MNKTKLKTMELMNYLYWKSNYNNLNDKDVINDEFMVELYNNFCEEDGIYINLCLRLDMLLYNQSFIKIGNYQTLKKMENEYVKSEIYDLPTWHISLGQIYLKKNKNLVKNLIKIKDMLDVIRLLLSNEITSLCKRGLSIKGFSNYNKISPKHILIDWNDETNDMLKNFQKQICDFWNSLAKEKFLKIPYFPFHTSIGYYKESKFEFSFDNETIYKSDNVSNEFLCFHIYGFFHETTNWKSYRTII
jgi:hypothetical protein